MVTLIFCAGAADPFFEAIEPAACRPDTLLVGVDAGAAALASAGFAPDLAVGDFDSARPPTDTRILRLPAEKDDTDLEAALAYVLSQHPPESVREILILGALGGGRLDHLLCNVWLAHQPRFAPWLDKIRFAERYAEAAFYRAGSHVLHRAARLRYLSFIGLSPLSSLTLSGVKYPLGNRDFAYPPALVSNEFLADTMCLSFASGLVCAIQSADCGAA